MECPWCDSKDQDATACAGKCAECGDAFVVWEDGHTEPVTVGFWERESRAKEIEERITETSSLFDSRAGGLEGEIQWDG